MSTEPHRGLLLAAAALSLLGSAPLATAQPPLPRASWNRAYPATSPSPRREAAMAYESTREQCLLFGGRTGTSPLGETWAWDGAGWQRKLSSEPPPRYAHGMAFDSARNRTVLFGGCGANCVEYGDTWEWNGTSWALRSSSGPPARRNHSMAYDAARGTTVLFGGLGDSGLLGDTWEWSGVGWTQRFPVHSPSARAGRTMCFDSVRNVVVLVSDDETWEWNGADWTRRQPSSYPIVGSNSAVAFDEHRGRTVVFLSATNADLVTWEWDGAHWQLNLDAPRRGVTTVAAAYDAAREQIVHFGGSGVTGGPLQTDETWLYVSEPRPSWSVFGQGCLGTAGIPTLAAPPGQLPVVGQSFALELSSLPPTAAAFGVLGRSRTLFGAIPLPFDLGVIGMTGCDLLVSLELSTPVPTVNGFGAWLVSVPNNPELAGEQLFVQGIVVDLAANPLGLTVTNAGEGTIGP